MGMGYLTIDEESCNYGPSALVLRDAKIKNMAIEDR